MRHVLRLALIAVLCGAVLWIALTWQRLPAAERGRRLAEHEGCFTCHGPGGLKGAANAGRTDKTVPDFVGDVMMYAHDAEDLRQWIHDGVPKRRANSLSWRASRDAGTLRMPAFGRKLNGGEIADLVAFVRASAGDPEPADSLAAAGLKRAEALGCVGCHGPGGRLAASNPRSLKGYIPSWDGADFADLVHGRPEFGEWVEHGVSERFRHNPPAQFFLHRAFVHMPAYEKHVAPGDVDALWAYIQWLRSTPH